MENEVEEVVLEPAESSPRQPPFREEFYTSKDQEGAGEGGVESGTNAGDDSVGVVCGPHSFRIRSYLTPTNCAACGKMLLGIYHQVSHPGEGAGPQISGSVTCDFQLKAS